MNYSCTEQVAAYSYCDILLIFFGQEEKDFIPGPYMGPIPTLSGMRARESTLPSLTHSHF